MLAIVLQSIVAPAVGVIGYLAVRRRLPRLAVDIRGIALQTVIVMVVLLAIAGAVAGVLLTRGGEAVEDVQRQQVTRHPSYYSTEPLCDSARYTWTTPAGGSGQCVG